MLAKKKLEELADACEKCMGEDSTSIEEHFESCPVCKDYSEQAEKVNQMLEVVQMLPSKSEEERFNILSARMEQFSTLPDDKRKDVIGDMLNAVGELSEEDLFKMVKTRTDIMVKLPKDKRQILMGSLQEVMSEWDMDRKMLEKRAVMAATQDYFILKRMMVRRMFNKMLSS